MVSQPACAAAAAAAVLWNRHGASVITSIITATQHRATVTREARIEGTQKGTYEIYLQLVHAGTLRENEGVIGRRGERKGKMGNKKRFAVVVVVSMLFVHVYKKRRAVQSVSLPNL